MTGLCENPWKGNVRELENALTRAVILAKGDIVLKENLPVDSDDRRTVRRELVSSRRWRRTISNYVLSAVKGSKPGQPDPSDQPADPGQEDQGL